MGPVRTCAALSYYFRCKNNANRGSHAVHRKRMLCACIHLNNKKTSYKLLVYGIRNIQRNVQWIYGPFEYSVCRAREAYALFFNINVFTHKVYASHTAYEILERTVNPL